MNPTIKAMITMNVLNVTWNASNITGIVSATVVINSTEVNIENRVVAEWEKGYATIVNNDCFFAGSLSVTLEAYNECGQNFPSNTVYIKKMSQILITTPFTTCPTVTHYSTCPQTTPSLPTPSPTSSYIPTVKGKTTSDVHKKLLICQLKL